MDTFFLSEFDEHLAVARAAREQLQVPFLQALEACVVAVRSGGKILLFGNGGSAADAQHLATELTMRYRKNRPTIAAIALTTDTSAMTAAGNDLGFEHIFARQVDAIGKAGDVAIGITTSGTSLNVIRAFEMCQRKGLQTVALTGGTGGEVVRIATVSLVVPSAETARIQEMHILLGQMLCGALEQRLGLVDG